MAELMKTPKAPLFRDPVLDGPADPMVIWNREEQSWWMLYTARRATIEGEKYAWCFGTGIGVASSTDGGRTFLYRGELSLPIEPGKNTYWAPEVIYHQGLYHMYVTYSRGVSPVWNSEYYTAHFTAKNMWEWHFEGFVDIDKGHDPCCLQMPDGMWRMWWRGNNGETVCAESADLWNWKRIGTVDTTRCEGPNVFYWKGYYWMIADMWNGIAVYRSDDALNWERKNDILNVPGTRPYDSDLGQHADVVVSGGHAYIFYFVNAVRNRDDKGNMRVDLTYDERRSMVQVAELEFDGDGIVCDRDKPFHMDLQAPEEAAAQAVVPLHAHGS